MGIHTLYRLIIILAALTLCISLASCGRGHRRSASTTGTDTQNNVVENNNTPAENTQPVFKPFPIMPEGNYPKSKVRQVSALEFSVTGADKVASLGYSNRIHESDPSTYVLIADSGNEIAYAQYNVEKLTEYRPVKIDFEMQAYLSSKEVEPLPLHYYIGIANYTKAIWEWNGPYTEKDPLKFSLTLNSQELRDRYVDKVGTLHFVVITSIKSAPKLSKLGRVGVGIKSSTTTISPDYLPNMPYCPIISNIYTGKKQTSALSAFNDASQPIREASANPFKNLLDPVRSTSALTEDQYVTIEWEHVYAFSAEDSINEGKFCIVYRKGPDDTDYQKIGQKDSKTGFFQDPVDVNIFEKPISEPIPGNKYLYKIAYTSSTYDETQKSSYKSIIPQMLPPAHVYATVGNKDDITLNWDAVDGAEYYEIWSSYITGDPNFDKLITIQAPDAPLINISFKDTSADILKPKYYKIKVIGVEKTQKPGVSEFSTEVFGVKGDFLYPPSDVAASDGISEKQVTITWKAPIEGTKPEGYSIWRSDVENGNYTLAGTVGESLVFQDTPPTKNTYWYIVKSIKIGVIDSIFCAKADHGILESSLLPPLTIEASTQRDNQIYIWWSTPPHSSKTAESYNVWRSTDQYIDYTIIAKDVYDLNYSDNDVVGDTKYWYKIQSNASGETSSGLSAECYGKICSLFEPESVKASNNDFADRIQITWTYRDSEVDPDSVIIYRSLDPLTDFISIASVKYPSTSYDDFSMQDDKTYYYKLVSYKFNYKYSNDSDIVSGQKANSLPPLSVSASDGTFDDFIRLNWSHNSYQIKGYMIYRSTSEYSKPYDLIATVGRVSQFDDTTVHKGTYYWYKITTIALNGFESDYSLQNRGCTNLGSPIWPMFGREPTHNRRSPFIGPSTFAYKWIASYPGDAYADPSIGVDGSLYIGSSNKLFAISPDGSNLWSWSQGYGLSQKSPAIGRDGSIYIGDYQNYLYSINRMGSTDWRREIKDDIETSPTIDQDGTIYLGSSDKNLYAIGSDGTNKWIFTTGGVVCSCPAIDSEGTIYVGSNDNNLYAINPNGKLKWSYNTGSSIYSSSPSIGPDGTIYIVSSNENLYAVNPNGSLKWLIYIGIINVNTPAIGTDGAIYIGCGNKNKLYSINPNGTINWEFKTEGYIYASPAIGADGTIYILDTKRNLYGINPDGSQKSVYSDYFGFDYLSTLIIGADGSLIINSCSGYLYAIGPGDGKNGLLPPVNVAASDGTDSSKIVVSWDVPLSGPVPDGYYIYHALSDKGVWQYIGKTSATSFDDTYAESGKTFYYKVQSYKFASSYNDSPDSAIDTGSRK